MKLQLGCRTHAKQYVPPKWFCSSSFRSTEQKLELRRPNAALVCHALWDSAVFDRSVLDEIKDSVHPKCQMVRVEKLVWAMLNK